MDNIILKLMLIFGNRSLELRIPVWLAKLALILILDFAWNWVVNPLACIFSRRNDKIFQHIVLKLNGGDHLWLDDIWLFIFSILDYIYNTDFATCHNEELGVEYRYATCALNKEFKKLFERYLVISLMLTHQDLDLLWLILGQSWDLLSDLIDLLLGLLFLQRQWRTHAFLSETSILGIVHLIKDWLIPVVNFLFSFSFVVFFILKEHQLLYSVFKKENLRLFVICEGDNEIM